MRYISIALATLGLQGCVTQQTLPEQEIPSVMIEAPSEKEQEIPKVVYEKPKKNMSLDELTQNFFEIVEEKGINLILFSNFGENSVLFKISEDDKFESSIRVKTGDHIELYGGSDGKLDSMKYMGAKLLKISHNNYTIRPISQDIDLDGPLKDPIKDILKEILSKAIEYSGEASPHFNNKPGEFMYEKKIEAPKFDKACATISGYVLQNK